MFTKINQICPKGTLSIYDNGSSILTARWNHPGSLKNSKIRYLDNLPPEIIQSVWGYGLCFGTVKRMPGDSNMQMSLGTIDLRKENLSTMGG